MANQPPIFRVRSRNNHLSKFRWNRLMNFSVPLISSRSAGNDGTFQLVMFGIYLMFLLDIPFWFDSVQTNLPTNGAPVLTAFQSWQRFHRTPDLLSTRLICCPLWFLMDVTAAQTSLNCFSMEIWLRDFSTCGSLTNLKSYIDVTESTIMCPAFKFRGPRSQHSFLILKWTIRTKFAGFPESKDILRLGKVLFRTVPVMTFPCFNECIHPSPLLFWELWKSCSDPFEDFDCLQFQAVSAIEHGTQTLTIDVTDKKSTAKWEPLKLWLFRSAEWWSRSTEEPQWLWKCDDLMISL